MMIPSLKNRPDLQLIADLIPDSARVLDIGCGSGELLEALRDFKSVDGRGMELNQSGVNDCVEKGLYVVQGDADQELDAFEAGRFDVVVLSKTLQAVEKPEKVLGELVRIADRAIVTIPNFGYWRVRWHLVTKGRMPVTKALPRSWYQTKSRHLCTIKDLMLLMDDLGLQQRRFVPFSEDGRRLNHSKASANLLAPHALFEISSK